VYYLLLFLPLLFLAAVPPVITFPTTDDAYRYAHNYLINYYHNHGEFPPSLSIPFYPYYSYSHGGAPTGTTGIPDGNQAWATVVFAGEDRKFGTADDRTLSLTASMLEAERYQQLYERSNTLEQAAYSICQRRLAEGITPIWPASLDEVIREANLPADYKYTPFGALYTYDTSSCKTNLCYCTQAVVKAP
jgi:hypothetical protein